jgi:type IV pilus assembly protein PilA
MLKRLRERAGSEKGFTLIELLVVMLILGILAAIAIPAFLNQKSKANDSQAKVNARTMQTAMETCATDNNGSYLNCDINAIRAIESQIPATGATVPVHTATTYTVTATAPTTNNTFSVARSATGAITHPCTVTSTNRGGCPGTGTAAGNW